VELACCGRTADTVDADVAAAAAPRDAAAGDGVCVLPCQPPAGLSVGDAFGCEATDGAALRLGCLDREAWRGSVPPKPVAPRMAVVTTSALAAPTKRAANPEDCLATARSTLAASLGREARLWTLSLMVSMLRSAPYSCTDCAAASSNFCSWFAPVSTLASGLKDRLSPKERRPSGDLLAVLWPRADSPRVLELLWFPMGLVLSARLGDLVDADRMLSMLFLTLSSEFEQTPLAKLTPSMTRIGAFGELRLE